MDTAAATKGCGSGAAPAAELRCASPTTKPGRAATQLRHAT